MKIEREAKREKMHRLLVHFFGGQFYFKIGEIMRSLAKLLGEHESNAKKTFPSFTFFGGTAKNSSKK